jgi:hypothetical protein
MGKLVFRFAEGAYHECVFDFAVFKFDDISALNGFIITAKNRGGGIRSKIVANRKSGSVVNNRFAL